MYNQLLKFSLHSYANGEFRKEIFGISIAIDPRPKILVGET